MWRDKEKVGGGGGNPDEGKMWVRAVVGGLENDEWCNGNMITYKIRKIK